jgi:citrate synthase
VEEVVQLLWDATAAGRLFCAPGAEPARFNRAGWRRSPPWPGLSADRAFHRGRQARVLHHEGQALVGQVATAFGAKPGPQPLHLRFAQGWKQTRRVADLLRTAMVLLVDHELTSSAFAARIAASTGASLPACLLAGLTTLSGPLHGDASGRVQALFSEVERLGADQVVAHYLSTGTPLAGFGHQLYPDGDPRAAALLALFEPAESDRALHREGGRAHRPAAQHRRGAGGPGGAPPPARRRGLRPVRHRAQRRPAGARLEQLGVLRGPDARRAGRPR